MAVDFSTRLRDIIESRGISQAWLAQQTGTTEATISRYMNGVHKPNLSIVAAIAKALNVSIDYIMDMNLSTTPYSDPDPDIVILANAYRRADDDHKSIVWAALDSYLTVEEKNRHRALDARSKQRHRSKLTGSLCLLKSQNTERASLREGRGLFIVVEGNDDQ